MSTDGGYPHGKLQYVPAFKIASMAKARKQKTHNCTNKKCTTSLNADERVIGNYVICINRHEAMQRCVRMGDFSCVSVITSNFNISFSTRDFHSF